MTYDHIRVNIGHLHLMYDLFLIPIVLQKTIFSKCPLFGDPLRMMLRIIIFFSVCNKLVFMEKDQESSCVGLALSNHSPLEANYCFEVLNKINAHCE